MLIIPFFHENLFGLTKISFGNRHTPPKALAGNKIFSETNVSVGLTAIVIAHKRLCYFTVEIVWFRVATVTKSNTNLSVSGAQQRIEKC